MAHFQPTSKSASERLYRGQRHPYPHTFINPRSYPPFDADAANAPWRGMSNTFTWVEEQEFLKARQGMPIKTEDWVKEQQRILKTDKAAETVYHMPRTRTSKLQKQKWEELIYVYEIEADQWMRHEERIRRVAHEREKTRLRIQEELRRIDNKYHQKREGERLAREEGGKRDQAEKERRDRARHDKLIVDAWSKYESRWSSLSSTTESLDFRTIPWPLIVPPKTTADIAQDAIIAFLYSTHHSQDQSRRERIRSAQLRWHPDRFRRFIGRVSEADRANVEDGINIVARVLNELMEKENKRN